MAAMTDLAFPDPVHCQALNLSDPALLKSFAYIGNKWMAGSEGATFDVTDPATGTQIGDVASMTARDSTAAVDAAQAAFPRWAGALPQDRAVVLRRWFELIVANREDLGRDHDSRTG